MQPYYHYALDVEWIDLSHPDRVFYAVERFHSLPQAESSALMLCAMKPVKRVRVLKVETRLMSEHVAAGYVKEDNQ